MRSAWGQSLVSFLFVSLLSPLGCAHSAKPEARSAREVTQARDPPAEAEAEPQEAASMPSPEALEALQAFFGGGGISREERHRARIAMARAQLVALNHAKRIREERETLEDIGTQLQRELEAARSGKTRTPRRR